MLEKGDKIMCGSHDEVIELVEVLIDEGYKIEVKGLEITITGCQYEEV